MRAIDTPKMVPDIWCLVDYVIHHIHRRLSPQSTTNPPVQYGSTSAQSSGETESS